MLDLKALLRPTDPEEAVRLFSEAHGTGLYVAGGTVIVPAGSTNLDFLVDLTSTGLDYVRSEDGYLCIGATARLYDLHESELVRSLASGIVSAAARAVANHTVRIYAAATPKLRSNHTPSDMTTGFEVEGSDCRLRNPKTGKPRPLPSRPVGKNHCVSKHPPSFVLSTNPMHCKKPSLSVTSRILFVFGPPTAALVT